MTAFPVRHSYPSLRPTHEREEGGMFKRIEETEGGKWWRGIKEERSVDSGDKNDGVKGERQ